MSQSPRCVVSGGGGRVVVHEGIYSGPASFTEFTVAKATFVDKSLAIEAFLRDRGGHHLILRPRRCGKSYTLSMIREFLQRKRGPNFDITTSQFAGMAITDHGRLVSEHFQQYPVLHIDLKDVHGTTFEDMLSSFDDLVLRIVRSLADSPNPLVAAPFIRFLEELSQPEAMQARRRGAFKAISQYLRAVYDKCVVVLMDEYDSPMHSAIEHGYAPVANDFFAAVFGSLLKGNEAVYASMMVGICKVAKFGWLSALNHLKIFPMHAEDDRYAKLLLFTEEEVTILCETTQSKLSIEMLQPRYNGYTATCNSGLVKLYNPFSVVSALSTQMISNFWVETGRHSPLREKLWRAGAGFRDDLDLLITQKSVKLVVDEHVSFESYDTITDAGLWGLLYYTGYLTIESVENRSMVCVRPIFFNSCSCSKVRICFSNPKWGGHFGMAPMDDEKPRVTSLSGVYDSITGGDAARFQRQFTAFLQKYLPLYCTLHHKEKVYQALFYTPFYSQFDKEYDVRMEQNAGHGRSDITAHPFSPQRLLALIFEIRSVARYLTRNGKRVLKTAKRMEDDLKRGKTEGLAQLAKCRYRERVPLHVTKVHEYTFVFCGKFCVAAVRTLERNAAGVWQEVTAESTDVSESMVEDADDEDADMVEEDVADEDEEATA